MCIRNAVVHKIHTNDSRLQSFDQFVFVAGCQESSYFQLTLQIGHLNETNKMQIVINGHTWKKKKKKNNILINLTEIHLHFGYIVVSHSAIDVFDFVTVFNVQQNELMALAIYSGLLFKSSDGKIKIYANYCA